MAFSRHLYTVKETTMTLSRLWFATLTFLCLAVALISTRAYLLPLAEVMPNMVGYLTSAPWALWGHLVFGPLAMLLVPVQLSSRIRAKWPRVHRISGYVSAVSILLGGLASLGLAASFEGSEWARIGFILLAVLWIGFTATGIRFAIRGDYARHRIWMLRGIAMTLAAVTLRLIMPVLILSGWSVLETYDVTAWASWVINLVLVEIWLRRGSLRSAQPA
jgi:hypothetical protein